MCIRDSLSGAVVRLYLEETRETDIDDDRQHRYVIGLLGVCLLYTSDAADERSSVDLGGRRIIKKKKIMYNYRMCRRGKRHNKTND